MAAHMQAATSVSCHGLACLTILPIVRETLNCHASLGYFQIPIRGVVAGQAVLCGPFTITHHHLRHH